MPCRYTSMISLGVFGGSGVLGTRTMTSTWSIPGADLRDLRGSRNHKLPAQQLAHAVEFNLSRVDSRGWSCFLNERITP